MQRILAHIVLIAATAMAAGQAPQAKPAAPPKPPVQPTIAPLTELERTKLENLGLQVQMLHTQEQLLQAEAKSQEVGLEQQRQQLVAAIERAHPGYRWQQAQFQGQESGLVPVTPEAKAEPKK